MSSKPMVRLDEERIARIAHLLSGARVPDEAESSDHSVQWTRGPADLANAYFAIVAICHQTSPLGERRLEGGVRGGSKFGWNYLKERFLETAQNEVEWTRPAFWRDLSSVQLSQLYADEVFGLTLNRVNERAYLLNDLGQKLTHDGVSHVHDAFVECKQRLAGGNGFLRYVRQFEAYTDPVRKKALFFVSLAVKECGWKVVDPDRLASPVDYHELRGHLRIGTVQVVDRSLRRKVQTCLTLTAAEDVELRRAVQQANAILAEKSHLTSSIVHYLLWNVFRNCCPRESEKTHCTTCGAACGLPSQYKDMPIYQSHCVFGELCTSMGVKGKVVDPPYMGHYY